MEITTDVFKQIENDVDNYLINLIDENIPRYKFIYHMNLIYIDYIVASKLMFTTTDKHLLYSLSYNTFLAYKKLREEDITDFSFDNNLYNLCYRYLILGMEYSMLCDLFPAIHSQKAELTLDEKTNYYSIKEEEESSWHLTKAYMNFWNENMLYEDFEPYSRQDWGGVTLFFTQAAMRRFTMLYREDFDIKKSHPAKKMIVVSPAMRTELANYTISKNMDKVEQVLEDFIYRPIGNHLFPKSNVSDAPIIQTKDGYLFVNPLVLLFNDSSETRLLNHLRKYDNSRHQRIKDKLKERSIPIIEYLLKKGIQTRKS